MRPRTLPLATATWMTLALLSIPGVSTASAAIRDRIPPTAPTNLQVTAVTSFSVSLTWSPSTDNSGTFSYRVHHSWGYEATLPRTQTSFTWTSNLEARQTYSFYVYAIDAAGNKSKFSNTVTVTLPPDTSPPTAPVVSVTDVGATHVSLSWTAQDDGPYIFYWVFKDGSPVVQGSTSTTATIPLLEPETTYTFTVQARDNGINWSPLSDPVTATTAPTDLTDTTPPTAPVNLSDFGMSFPDGETWLFWEQSTDDQTPQSLLAYEVRVNGVLDHIVVGRGSTILYAPIGIANTFEVIAVDAAGNRSAPATLTIDLR